MTSWFARNRRSSSCSWQDQPRQQLPLRWKPTTGSSSISSQSHRIAPPLATIHPNHLHSIEMSQLSENSSVVSSNQSNNSRNNAVGVGGNLGQESQSSYSYTSTGGIVSHRTNNRTRNDHHLLWKPSLLHQQNPTYHRTTSLPAAPSRVSPSNASMRSAMAAMAPGITPAAAFDTNAISKQVLATTQAKLEALLQRKLQDMTNHAHQLQEQLQNQVQAYAEQSSQASIKHLEKESSRLEQNQRAFYRRMVASEEEYQERCGTIEKQLARVDQQLKIVENKTDFVEQQTGKFQALYTKLSGLFKATEQRIVNIKETLLDVHPSENKVSNSSSKRREPYRIVQPKANEFTDGKKKKSRTLVSTTSTVSPRNENTIMQKSKFSMLHEVPSDATNCMNEPESLHSTAATRNSHKNVVDSIPRHLRKAKSITQQYNPYSSPLTFKSCVTPCDKENEIAMATVVKTPLRQRGSNCRNNNNKKRSQSNLLESSTEKIDYDDDGFPATRKKKMRKQRFGGRTMGITASSGAKKPPSLKLQESKKTTRATTTTLSFADFDNDDDWKFTLFP